MGIHIFRIPISQRQSRHTFDIFWFLPKHAIAIFNSEFEFPLLEICYHEQAMILENQLEIRVQPT